MARSSEVADLYVALRATAAPLRAEFGAAAASGEEMAASITQATGTVQLDMTRAVEALNGFVATVDRAAGSVAAASAKIDESMTAVAGATGRAAGEASAAAAETAGAFDREAFAAQASADRQLAAFRAEAVAFSEAQMKMRGEIDATAASMSTASTKMVAADARAAKSNRALGDAVEGTSVKSTAAGTRMGGVHKAILGIGAVAIYAADKSLHMAADFQTSTNRLVTSAGEAAGPNGIGKVRDGLLKLSSEVGVSSTDLSTAMYKVSSASYHGAAGLGLLKAAEQGAKAEGADGAKVADALSSAMRDYYPHASSAADVTKKSADVMSKLVAATSTGKMTFDDLAGGLNNILPIASQAHIKLDDVLGVLSSMTVHGISAQQATENIAHAMQKMQGPTTQMSKAMATVGVDSIDVAQKLGQRGLSGTLQYLSDAVKKAMPPGTDKVILDLGTALSQSTPKVQALGQQVLQGSMSMGTFGKEAKKLDPISYGQAKSFVTLANSYHQLGNKQLTGGQVLQTYGGMMKKVTGDATTLKVALMTTGENTNYTNNAVKTISKSTADAAGNVRGWGEIQGTFNQKMAQAKAGAQALAIQVGTHLLPVASKIASVFASATGYLTRHQGVAKALSTVLGVVLAGAAITATAAMVKLAARMVATPFRLAGSAANSTASLIGKLGLASVDAEKPALSLAKTWGSNIVSGAQTAGRGVVDLTTKVGSGFVSAAGRGVSKAGELASALGGKTVTAAKALGSGVVQLGEKMVASFLPAIGSAIASAWSFTAALLANPITWVVIGIVALIAAIVLLVTHWKQVSAWLKSVWSAFIKWASALFSRFGDWWNSLWSGIWNWVKSIWTSIKNWVVGIAVSMVSWLISHWNSFISFWSNLWSRVSNGLSSAWNSMMAWLGRIPGQILSFFAGIGSWLANAGWNLLVGLWNGIAKAAGWLWDKISGWAQSIIHHIESMFGIASPSKVTAKHGMYLVQGLAAGIDNYTGVAVAAAKKMTGAVVNAAQGGLGGAGGMTVNHQLTAGGTMGAVAGAGGLALTSGVGGGNTTVYLTVQGNAITERELADTIETLFLQKGARRPVTYSNYQR